jgi:ATP-dependent Lon protease
MDNETISLDALLNEHFQGKVVRKDLTKLLKEGANVPVYVLEYLLGMYCASEDEDVIRVSAATDLHARMPINLRQRISG